MLNGYAPRACPRSVAGGGVGAVAGRGVARDEAGLLDDAVEDEYDSIYRQGITFMMEDPRTITRMMDLMWMARALERIGDHAKNIAELIIYIVKGTDVRHTPLDEVENAVK